MSNKNDDRRRRNEQRDLTTVELFCGAGGLSLGFAAAGFKPVLALDHNAAAVATYRENLGEEVQQHEISTETTVPTATVFVGGPPCQGFSSAGLRRSGDERNTLVTCFARIVARHQPSAFVFENVEGFLTAESGARVLDLLTPLIDAGYRIHLRKVNAANFGVPQHRKRVLAIGALGWDPTFPVSTHAAFGAPGAHLGGKHLPRTPTLLESIADLPAPASVEPGEPCDHFYSPLTGADLKRAEALRPGQTMRDLPESMWHDSYRRRAFRRVMDGTPSERRGGAPAGLRRLRGDEPCKAITGGARSEFLHPLEHRNLTIRECARIQTFPDAFNFQGTLAERIQLIGNAVPPLLATAVAKSLAHDLRTAVRSHTEGALLTFVPTLATAMSPALEEITGKVLAAFRTGSRMPAHDAQLELWR